MKNCIVAYHYIRDTSRWGFHRLPVADFVRQLDWLQEHFAPLDPDALVQALRQERNPPPGFLLTFDDGLREHKETVFPLLKERGLRAMFFPHVRPLTEELPPVVNQLQVLVVELSPDQLEKMIVERLRQMGPPYAELRAVPAAQRAIKRMDTTKVADIKFFLNFTLPWEASSEIISDIFAETAGDPRAFAKELYLTGDEIRDMQKEGMVFGGHTVSHQYMTRLSPEQQAAEVKESVGLLAEILGHPLESFAYPFGHHDPGARAAAAAAGVVAAFTTEPEDNLTVENALSIGRYDTVLLPPVKKFTVDELPNLSLG